ncbi:putative polysaccharide biosynthesis protein [Paenibacillus protaetiae]|uniref:Polysaccharide biosynthesis protein n=1 Tax=Paenibacillus protaetiae TaxID=2509456 RepID=A0A4P6F4U3_9BACL|nr:polysaccharide biosynthesis protein [Paenibacillus protaetiae]QAY68207.1 polysaccharide biosynthesis protein [Paenibacillus protaetiae]
MLKKDSLLKGTVILAMAALVARVLGVFQRVPLDYIMKDAGDAYFGVANTVYLTLLVIATGGIPSAISKMVSERYALQRPEEAQQIYKAALLFGIVTGLIITALLYVFAPYYAIHIVKTPGAETSIRAIAPALLLFPVIAMMRGYFQGRQMMAAGGISQIVEQIMRVVVGVAIAFLFFSWGWGDRWTAAAATFGSVFGSIGAFIVMLWFARKLKRQDKAAAAEAGEAAIQAKPAAPVLKLSAIYREIFKMSIPVVVTGMTVQLIYLFDSSFLVRLTESFYSYSTAVDVLGQFNFKAQSIAGIPPILAIALSQSIIPVISAAYSVRNMREVQRQSSLVMRIVVFTGVPAALALTVTAYSVTGLLFSGTDGSGIVAVLTAGTIFQITMMTSNSILFGLGRPSAPMKHTLIGIALKIVLSIALAPLMGIYGLIVSSTICFIMITWMNLEHIRRITKLNVLGGRWPAYMAAIVVSAGAGYGVDAGLRALLAGLPDKLAFLIAAAFAGGMMVILYIGLLAVLRVVTPEDARSFPGPLRKVFVRLTRNQNENQSGGTA